MSGIRSLLFDTRRGSVEGDRKWAFNAMKIRAKSFEMWYEFVSPYGSIICDTLAAKLLISRYREGIGHQRMGNFGAS